MTPDEAMKSLRIMMDADGECLECGADLVNRFVKTFPEFKMLAIRLFDEKWTRDFPFKGHKNILVPYLEIEKEVDV